MLAKTMVDRQGHKAEPLFCKASEAMMTSALNPTSNKLMPA